MIIQSELNPTRIALSGQCFRWEETAPGTFRVPFRDKCLIIETQGSGAEVKNPAAEDAVWHEYLDLDTDYAAIRERIDAGEDPFLHEACCFQQGIRILKQDPWEALISFIISQNRNIPAIKRSISILCDLAGEERKDLRGESFMTFPTAGAIASMSDEELDQCRLGYRKDYIRLTAEAAVSGELDLDKLAALDDGKLMGQLISLKGVGPKVASCVMLYGFHRINAFPVDVWVKRILKDKYPGGYPFEKYAPYNGIYQQYMFAFYREENT